MVFQSRLLNDLLMGRLVRHAAAGRQPGAPRLVGAPTGVAGAAPKALRCYLAVRSVKSGRVSLASMAQAPGSGLWPEARALRNSTPAWSIAR